MTATNIDIDRDGNPLRQLQTAESDALNHIGSDDMDGHPVVIIA